MVSICNVVVKGKKGTQDFKMRLQDSKVGAADISWIDGTKRVYSNLYSRGKVAGVTVKFDPGFFRTGIFGQVAVLTVQSDASEKLYETYDEMIKVVGATRVWNWPSSKFETTIPMRNWHDGNVVFDEDDTTRWTVLVGLKIAKRDAAVDDDDEVLRISVQWLLDCPKQI